MARMMEIVKAPKAEQIRGMEIPLNVSGGGAGVRRLFTLKACASCR